MSSLHLEEALEHPHAEEGARAEGVPEAEGTEGAHGAVGAAGAEAEDAGGAEGAAGAAGAEAEGTEATTAAGTEMTTGADTETEVATVVTEVSTIMDASTRPHRPARLRAGHTCAVSNIFVWRAATSSFSVHHLTIAAVWWV